MSLILDALRKADAERERGSVPSLHSHPVVETSADAPPRPKARPHWLWIAIGVVLGLVASAILVMVGRDATVPSPATANLSPAPSSNSTTTDPGSESRSIPPPPATFSNAQPAAEPAPWPQPERLKSPRGDANDVATSRVVGTAPATGLVLSREQLPPEIRGALPQFAIGGSIYSPDPTARSLIINGQLYREKDRLMPDLALEEIKLKSAIFNFRGYRFEVLF